MLQRSTIICATALLLMILLCAQAAVPSTVDRETHATKAEGTLTCGKTPLKNAVVRLFRGNSDDVGDVIGETTTDQYGKFVLQGDTGRFATEKANLDPHLKIYHKCDDEEGASGYRRFTLRYPREYVSLGSFSRRTYNVGQLNLELTYPEETRQTTIVGYKGPQIH